MYATIMISTDDKSKQFDFTRLEGDLYSVQVLYDGRAVDYKLPDGHVIKVNNKNSISLVDESGEFNSFEYTISGLSNWSSYLT